MGWRSDNETNLLPADLPAGQSAGELRAEEITAQVDRILASPDFVQAKRLGNFLKFIVAETLAGRSDRLKEYTIGIEVFERDESFECAPARPRTLRSTSAADTADQ